MLHHDIEHVVVLEVGLVPDDVPVAADFEEVRLGHGFLLHGGLRGFRGFLLVLCGVALFVQVDRLYRELFLVVGPLGLIAFGKPTLPKHLD